MAGLSTSPMSVKEITAKAEAFDFNPQIPLKYWLRTADALIREVSFAIFQPLTIC